MLVSSYVPRAHAVIEKIEKAPSNVRCAPRRALLPSRPARQGRQDQRASVGRSRHPARPRLPQKLRLLRRKAQATLTPKGRWPGHGGARCRSGGGSVPPSSHHVINNRSSSVRRRRESRTRSLVILGERRYRFPNARSSTAGQHVRGFVLVQRLLTAPGALALSFWQELPLLCHSGAIVRAHYPHFFTPGASAFPHRLDGASCCRCAIESLVIEPCTRPS